jgi:DNA mismatch repair protein PMS2
VEATAAEEIVITDNVDVFKANGLQMQVLLLVLTIALCCSFLVLQVDESAPPGRRIQLTAVPFSKHVQFGAQGVPRSSLAVSRAVSARTEVHELASLLSEDLAPGAKDTLVLPKLASVYASRACRGAVMIGTPLSITQMQRIVKQMGGMEQPWNCPHG